MPQPQATVKSTGTSFDSWRLWHDPLSVENFGCTHCGHRPRIHALRYPQFPCAQPLTILYAVFHRTCCTTEDGMDRILIIDDDFELCSLVTEYLAAEGFRVESVHDGETGLKRATSSSYLLIILDVMLPGMSGFDVLRRLRATSRIP